MYFYKLLHITGMSIQMPNISIMLYTLQNVNIVIARCLNLCFKRIHFSVYKLLKIDFQAIQCTLYRIYFRIIQYERRNQIRSQIINWEVFTPNIYI